MITRRLFRFGVAFDRSGDLPQSLCEQQVCALFVQKLSNEVMLEERGILRGLTFEVTGRRRQDAKPGPMKMYRVPPARAWWPAVGAPVDRGVRPGPRWARQVIDLMMRRG